MALSANMVWEIRTAGSDNNGGAFVTGASGVDRSQQNAAHATLTAASVVHSTTTQINVSAGDYTVTANDVGNVLQVTGGTATPQFYEITAVDIPNNRWTVDKSVGTAGQTVVGAMGGALASLGKFGFASSVTGMIVWIKAGTYSVTTASTNVSNGCYDNNGAGGIRIEGYNATRGDRGTKPLIQASGITNFTLINFNTNNAHVVVNLKLDGISAATSCGLNFRCKAYLCEGVNFTNSAFKQNASQPVCYSCTASGCSTQPAFRTVNCVDCVAFNNTVTGFSNTSTQLCSYLRCIADSNSGASSDGFTYDAGTLFTPAIMSNCVAYNNGRDGFRLNGSKPFTAHNCIAEGNAGVGFNATSLATGGYASLLNCAGYNNTGGNVSGFTGVSSENLNFQTLTGSPFTDAPNQDFSLNNTASAGAACRGAGTPGAYPNSFPTTGYIDIGAAQHQDTGGGGSTPTSVAYLG